MRQEEQRLRKQGRKRILHQVNMAWQTQLNVGVGKDLRGTASLVFSLRVQERQGRAYEESDVARVACWEGPRGTPWGEWACTGVRQSPAALVGRPSWPNGL